MTLIIVLLLPLSVRAESSFPKFPMTFWGQATLNGNPLPQGTLIAAFISDIKVGEVAMSEDGIYGYNHPFETRLLVAEYSGSSLLFKYRKVGDSDYIAGSTNVVYVNNFEPGKVIELNLGFTKQITVPTPPPSTPRGGGGGGGGGGIYLPPSLPSDTTPPAVPGNIKINKVSDSSVSISWTKPTDSDFSHVVIYRSNESGNYGSIVYDNVTETELIDSGIVNNIVYYYSLRSADRSGNLSNYSTQIGIKLNDGVGLDEPVVLGVTIDPRQKQIENIISEATALIGNDFYSIWSNWGTLINSNKESEPDIKYIEPLIKGKIASQETRNNIRWFISYGSPMSAKLGEGERAGVVNSFISSFGKLPETKADWEDILKISNGRWPTQRNEAKENQAKESFRRIYLRNANMDNPNDNAAVTIMSYGLRPSDRNLNSESVAINTFKWLYKYQPSTAVDWDIVRAIAYSGATR
jgi:hypothetical protein